MVSKRYEDRKARMAADPAYRAAIHAAQSASRRRRRQLELEQSEGVCGHRYANDRRCWKSYKHKHAGVEVDPMARELVAG